MRKKVRRALAVLLAIAIAMSVMTGMALSAPAEGDVDSEANTSATTEVAPEEQTDVAASDAEEQTDVATSDAEEQQEAEPEEPAKDAEEPQEGTEDGASAPTPAAQDTQEEEQDRADDATSGVTKLQQQTVKAAVRDASATITLTGKMPVGATAKARSVSVNIDGMAVLAAYDITIYDADSKEFQPDAASSIQVTIQDGSLKGTQEVSVYHMENKNAAPEKVGKDVSVQGNAVTFDAESFSIYAMGQLYTHTYTFMNGTDMNGTETWNTQILSTGEKLNEPKSPVKDGYVFQGWYTGATSGMKFTSWNTEEELTENETTTLHARFAEAYYVFYKAGNSADSKVLYTQKYENGSTIVTDDVPFSTTTEKALIGWSTNPTATAPNTTLTINGASVTLYPVLANVHWIEFESNGGSAVDPIYVLSSAKTPEMLESPAKDGYAFAGWYKDDGFANAYVSGESLTETLKLYAKWTPKMVSYKVLYWNQNADDDGYSLAESVQKSGMTGTMTSASADQSYNGFSQSTTKIIKQQTIAGDGSTVVNVYYDRNTYQVKFYYEDGYGNTTGNIINELTINAKYGADIASQWPSRRTGLSRTYPSNWWTGTYSGNNPYRGKIYQGGISTMPLNGAKFYLEDSDGRYTVKTDFYLESLSGEYILDHTDSFKSSNNAWQTTTEDYYDIKGFTVDYDKSSRVGSNPQWNGRIGTWKFYYTRNTYKINFYNSGVDEKNEEYKYQADISNAGYTPTAPTGKSDYTFEGWYTNELREGEAYTFTGKTMPAGNFALYAKWVAPTYTVEFDLNGGTDGDEYAVQAIKKEEVAKKPENSTREGYTFTGWTKNDKPFNFNTKIIEDTTLVAQWISNTEYTLTYNANGGAGSDVVDSTKYVDGSKAELRGMPTAWAPPVNNYGFVCWTTDPAGTGTKYYPGDAFEMPAANTTLYAQWAPIRKTTLTYNFNYTGAPADKTIDIETPNEQTTINETDPTREGYTFSGWNTKANGTGHEVQAGDQVQVNTLNPETNVLYAQWRKIVTVTVKKDVTGNMGDTDKEFSFTATGTKPKNFTLQDMDKHADSTETFQLEVGDTITITETVYNGYATSYKVDNGAATVGNSYTLAVGEGTSDVTVTFINNKQIDAPTGLTSNTTPYLIMVGTAATAGVGYVVLRHRRRFDDR